MKKLLGAALLLLVPESGALAASDNADRPAKEKKVCRSEKITGSLTRVRRICMTQAEWDELARRTKKGLDDAQRDAAGGMNSQFTGAGSSG